VCAASACATSPALEGIARGQLYLGTANGCAVLEADGSLWCWGANQDGQLALPAEVPVQPHLATRIVIPSP
jgi:alpha-tubulin suppressor-like RCC1 family protein